jgi:iron(III) transport system substrate-binding protein
MKSRNIVSAMAGLTVAAAAVMAASPALAQSFYKGYNQAEWAKTVAAANKEGRVTLYYVSTQPVVDRIKAAFNKQYPNIQLDMLRLVGTELVGKLDQERATGADGGDVAITPETQWAVERAKDKGVLQPVGPASVNWPAKYVLNGVAPMVGMEPLIIVYNSKLVTTPVTGYQDLLRPEFKGKVATPDLVANIFFAFYEWQEQTLGAKFLPALAAQNPRFYPSCVPITQQIIVGELLAESLCVATIVTPLIAQGAPIKMVVPKPAVATPFAGVIAAWSKRPAAAQVFMDFVISPAGQGAWAALGEMASPIPNVPNALDINSMVALDPSRFTPDVAKEYRAKWNKMFNK